MKVARISQVKPSNCFRCLEKLVLPSIFDTSFIVDDVKIAELSDSSFEGKNVTFYGEGIKTYTLTPYTYFQVVKPQPEDLRPLVSLLKLGIR